MKLVLAMILSFVSTTTFAYPEKIEKWKENSLISEQFAIDYIYEFAYDRFYGDDGETCEVQMDYAKLVKFKNEKLFIVEAEFGITNIDFWACRHHESTQGFFELKFTYDEEFKRFTVKEFFKPEIKN